MSDLPGKHMYCRPSLWNHFKLQVVWWDAVGDFVNSVLFDWEPMINPKGCIAVTALIEATEKS